MCDFWKRDQFTSIVRIDTTINQVVFVSSLSKSSRTNDLCSIVFANQYSEKLSLSQKNQQGRRNGRYVKYSSLEEVEFINQYFIQRAIEKLQGKKITKPVTWFNNLNTTLQKGYSISTFKRRIHDIIHTKKREYMVLADVPPLGRPPILQKYESDMLIQIEKKLEQGERLTPSDIRGWGRGIAQVANEEELQHFKASYKW